MRIRREGLPRRREEDMSLKERTEEALGEKGVPESELSIEFVRSSGPGGQKVNKTSSKAQLRWNIGESPQFTEEEKCLIRKAAGKRLNSRDEIVLSADTERSQIQNRHEVIARLDRIIDGALSVKKERKETIVSRTQKKKRLEEKRRTAQKKQMRRPPKGGW